MRLLKWIRHKFERPPNFIRHRIRDLPVLSGVLPQVNFANETSTADNFSMATILDVHKSLITTINFVNSPMEVCLRGWDVGNIHGGMQSSTLFDTFLFSNSPNK